MIALFDTKLHFLMKTSLNIWKWKNISIRTFISTILFVVVVLLNLFSPHTHCAEQEIGEPLSPRGSPVHLATKTGNWIIKLREVGRLSFLDQMEQGCERIKLWIERPTTDDRFESDSLLILLLQGQCCSDGVHCCEYGYTCDSSNLRCRKVFTDVPQE